MISGSEKPHFFKTAGDFRRWLAANHSSASEFWVGYYKQGSGQTSLTYSDSVDQALCFGWIDGVRYSIDEISYKIRFTPRKPRSIWSTVNLKKVATLMEQGLMEPAGIAVFKARSEDRSEVYAFEKKAKIKFDPTFAKKLKANRKAAAFFMAQIPSYQRTATHWVMSAKQEETRQKRMQQLIADSATELWIPPLRRAQRRTPKK